MYYTLDNEIITGWDNLDHVEFYAEDEGLYILYDGGGRIFGSPVSCFPKY